ncbi:MAG: nicotinamide mononucleotide transporter [Pirellulales bacterium]|nr:nicotinamide mononucleotide transporter [Pirellulales bacterium]
MDWIEATAVFFGLLCVWLTVRQNILCWPTGLVQVVLYLVIFYRVKLYSDLILHVIYVVLQVYGWYHWLHGGKDRNNLPVSRLGKTATLVWSVIGISGTVVWGYTMASLTDAAIPYGDAFTTVTSLIAQWLMARKRLESWLFWIAVDVIAIGIYFQKDLLLTSGLYTVFLVLATLGYITWRKSLNTDSLEFHDNGTGTGKVRASTQGASAID